MIQRFFDYLLKNQVIFALVLIIGGWFILETKDILASFFLSYIIMAALLPFVSFLKRKGLPHALSVIIPFLGTLLVIFLLVLPLIPFFVSQIQALTKTFPTYLDKSANIFGMRIDASELQRYLSTKVNTIGENAVAVTGRVFGSIFASLTLLIVSFYLLMYHDRFKQWFSGMFNKNTSHHVSETISFVDDKLGAWLRGQIILSFSIGLASWIALSLVGIPYALPLALMAGILELVPTLGPILAAVPAVIVALTISPTMALVVVGIYILIQLLENHILVPNIMQRAVGLNPVVVIIGITIGAHLMGIFGALLSIPFISFLTVIFNGLNAVDDK